MTHDGQLVGKGMLIAQYFATIGVRQIYAGYQIVWQI
jgi:hypothetical protein